jgi:hypothetical protein
MKIDYVNHGIFMSQITLNNHNTTTKHVSQSLCNSTQTHPNGKELVENQSLVDHFHQTCVHSGFLVGIAHYLFTWVECAPKFSLWLVVPQAKVELTSARINASYQSGVIYIMFVPLLVACHWNMYINIHCLSRIFRHSE